MQLLGKEGELLLFFMKMFRNQFMKTVRAKCTSTKEQCKSENFECMTKSQLSRSSLWLSCFLQKRKGAKGGSSFYFISNSICQFLAFKSTHFMKVWIFQGNWKPFFNLDFPAFSFAPYYVYHSLFFFTFYVLHMCEFPILNFTLWRLLKVKEKCLEITENWRSFSQDLRLAMKFCQATSTQFFV